MMTPLLALAAVAPLQNPVTLTVHADRAGAPISPSLYGIFFEEINQAGDGGLYAELLRNRGLETGAGPNGFPVGWINVDGASVVEGDGPNAAHTRSILIEDGGTVANTGFWGINVEKGERYHVVLWAKGSGEVSVGFGDGSRKMGKPGAAWRRMEYTLRPTEGAPNVRFVVGVKGGPVSIGYASLMPEKTWKGRKNGLRPDLAEKVADMKPAFVRFPGGCYVEGGDRFADAFDWKRSIGPVEDRKGVAHSMWGYPNTFGLGYHEYLQWCEDLGAEPLFVVNAGINHRQLTPMDEMGKWTQDALDAIEYANGPTTSTWGALRAKNGHPQPFNLKYVEIGNENGGWFFGGNEAYTPRYRVIYDAIKAKYPGIVTIADWKIDAPMEVIDEHYYESPAWFWKNSGKYDAYDRSGPKIYVGEYAVTKESGMGNLDAALGEAAFMTGMERNSDIVRMSSYAPLFVNVNNRQWNPNAIVFNSAQEYGTPSYHVQAMFANNRPTRNVAIDAPATVGEPPRPGGGFGLMTWNTQAEFRDVRVTRNGRDVYSSQGITAADVSNAHGKWTVSSTGVIAQGDLETDRSIMLKNARVESGDTYTLELKARKLAGREGFILITDEKDGGSLNWNVGGWNNTQTAFQRGGIVGTPIDMKVEANRWYNLKIERGPGYARGYIDGKLVQELKEVGSPDLAAVAGIDDKTKELVVKVVNGSNDSRTANLELLGARVGSVGKAFTLTGPSLASENSFAEPRLIVPSESQIPNVSDRMPYTFAPRSVTVLRIPIR